ncbi:MAG: DUF1611 domain-containing protein [Planctomycetes bacterium]|nr:DUF1611 domain-containing protein [Planctomycetota bacterium]
MIHPFATPHPLPPISSCSPIKWGYAADGLHALPARSGDSTGRLALDTDRPRAHDVLVARVVEVGEHQRIDLRDWTKSVLFRGDLVGVVLASRYATRRIGAEVPGSLDELHFVCSGGVCGRVTSVAEGLRPPTVLQPVGYLRDERGERVNLRAAAPAIARRLGAHVPVVFVVGASMDSGKTTAAASLVHGLTCAGRRVAAGKLTGTASIGDLLLMRDAGAVRARDFTTAGFGSTAFASAGELVQILDVLMSDLASADPEVVVFEIADGLLQEETTILLDHVAQRGLASAVLYTSGDAMAVRSGLDRLRSRALPVVAVSGTVTIAPLGVLEAQREADVPVLTRDQLCAPDVALALLRQGRTTVERAHAAG